MTAELCLNDSSTELCLNDSSTEAAVWERSSKSQAQNYIIYLSMAGLMLGPLQAWINP